MKKITFFTSILMLYSIFIYSQKTTIKDYKYVVHFETDQDDLNQHAKSQLEKRLNDFLTLNIQSIELIGHTDMRGSLAYNEDLSMHRASTIQQFLIDKGMNNFPISVAFKGEVEPQIKDDSEEALSINRRVEIWFYVKEMIPEVGYVETSRVTTYPESVPYVPTPKVPKPLTDYQKFHQQLDKGYQSYSFNNMDGRIIEGKEGTIIYFDPNSFCDCETQEDINGEIEIRLKEYYSLSDFLKAGLNTSNNNKALQSAGTIDIDAYSNDDKVCLKDGQDYKILFPKNKMNEDNYEDMRLFVGNFDEEGEVNWGVMGRNTLLNWNAVRFNNFQRDSSPRTNCYKGDCKLRFIKRVQLFFTYRRTGWKSYKYGRSKEGRAARKALFEEFNQRRKKRNELLENFQGDMNEFAEQLKDLKTSDELLFDYYLTKSTRMGLINCDRFRRLPKDELIMVNVPINYSQKISAKIVMAEENAIVRGYQSRSQNKIGYSFGNLPIGKNVTIIAYDYSKEKPKFAQKTFKLGENISLESEDFKECTFEEFSQQLASIN